MQSSAAMFRALFVRAHKEGKVHVPCEEARAKSLRMQVYGFRRSFRKIESADAELLAAVEDIVFLVDSTGLTAVSKTADPAMQALFSALGGDAGIKELSAPPDDPQLAADAAASLKRLQAMMDEDESEQPAPPVKQNPYY